MTWQLPEYLSPSGCINFQKLERDFKPFVDAMKDCAQDQKYHKEGNVWNHTRLCLEALNSIDDFITLDDEERSIVFLAALLHDVAKPNVSKEADGSITSKKHSIVGARMAREILWGLDSVIQVPWHVRESVSNLILLHMLPVHFIEKEDPFYSIFGASMVVKNKWLAALSLADCRGRICENKIDQEHSIHAIDFFSSLSRESECYESPKEFKSDCARFRYFFEHKGHPDYDRFEEISGKVIMMSGLQASGKNYTIDRQYRDLELVGLDETREDLGVLFGEDEGEVMRNTKEQCKELMRKKKNFVFNATNTVKDIRAKWIRLFRQYLYKVDIHYVERPLETILIDNKKRKGSAVIPASVILEKFAKIDVPTKLECHNLILGVPYAKESHYL